MNKWRITLFVRHYYNHILILATQYYISNMKSYNLLYVSFLFMSSLTEVNAQVLSHLTVREELKPRMEKAIEMAKSYSLPSWCDTQELQKKREVIIEKV